MAEITIGGLSEYQIRSAVESARSILEGLNDPAQRDRRDIWCSVSEVFSMASFITQIIPTTPEPAEPRKLPWEIIEVETWEDLAQVIFGLSPDERAQPIQAVLPTSNDQDTQECLPGIAIGTVARMEFSRCRSTHNNRWCGDDIVLLLDRNHYGPDGAYGFSHVDGKPIYGKSGPTNPDDQRAPEPRHAQNDPPIQDTHQP